MKKFLFIVSGLACLGVSAYFFYWGLYGGTSSDFYHYIVERPDYLLTLGQAQMRVGVPIASLFFGVFYFIIGLRYSLINKWAHRSVVTLAISVAVYFVLLVISMTGQCFGCTSIPAYVNITYTLAYYLLVIGILLSLVYAGISVSNTRKLKQTDNISSSLM